MLNGMPIEMRPCRSIDMHPLIRLRPRGAGERRDAAVEVEDRAGQRVDAPRRIATNARLHATSARRRRACATGSRDSSRCRTGPRRPPRGCCGCWPDRRCSSRTSSGSTPDADLDRTPRSRATASHDGWRRYMKASISVTPSALGDIDHLLGVRPRSSPAASRTGRACRRVQRPSPTRGACGSGSGM